MELKELRKEWIERVKNEKKGETERKKSAELEKEILIELEKKGRNPDEYFNEMYLETLRR